MRILFVCMGNICRSPTAEGVFRKVLSDHAPELDVEIDSAGTHGYHIGHPPDVRAQTAANARGVDLSAQRARRVTQDDFSHFDMVVAMDRDNLADLREMCPHEYRPRLRLLMEFASASEFREVPDPYYGGANGFEQVIDLVEEASLGLVEELREDSP